MEIAHKVTGAGSERIEEILSLPDFQKTSNQGTSRRLFQEF